MRSRRYNAANETSKEFYIRRTNEMKAVIDSPAWKKMTGKWWAEYKKINNLQKSHWHGLNLVVFL